MSCPQLASRRSLLTAAATAPLAAVWPPQAMSHANTIRALSLEWLAALKLEDEIECCAGASGFPAYRAAQAASEAIESRIGKLAQQLSPPRGWDDVVALAEFARHWNDGFRAGIPHVTRSQDTVALVHLANAVLFLAGRISNIPAPPFMGESRHV